MVVRSDDARSRLVDREWTPLDAASTFVMVYCRQKLASGEPHTCRGVRSAQGVAYRLIFDAAIDRLAIGGRISA